MKVEMRVYSRFCRSKFLTFFLLNNCFDPVVSYGEQRIRKWKRGEVIVAEYKRIVQKCSCKRNIKTQNKVQWEDTRVITRKSLV